MMKSFQDLLEASLRRNLELNPKLWDGESLKPEVRTALLNFGEAWRNFAKIPKEKVIDVLMVGGNASYYYNEESDIDVHLLVNRADLGFGPMVDEYLKDRKSIWTIRHDVRVKGYSVEPYAQDVTESSPAGQGVFSLTRNSWVQKPINTDYDPATDSVVKKRTANWQAAIDKLVEDGAGIDEFDALKNKLSEMRGRAIRLGGELSRDNLVFKSLRLSGHLDKMTRYVKKKQVEGLSLN